MKKLHIAAVAALLSLFGVSAEAQTGSTAQTQTTLSAAVTTAQNYIVVASTTNLVANNLAYVDNEAMLIESVNLVTRQITVVRGYAGTKAFGHKTGTMVLSAPASAYISYDPNGTCAAGQGVFQYFPTVNVVNGNQWLCSSVTGKVVPGFANSADLPQTTTAVASAAGFVTPSGPLFHVTGTAAITGFTVPVGFDPTAGGTICAIPDGAFTTTTANNIAAASTASVSRVLCWAYDAGTSKFFPYY